MACFTGSSYWCWRKKEKRKKIQSKSIHKRIAWNWDLTTLFISRIAINFESCVWLTAQMDIHLFANNTFFSSAFFYIMNGPSTSLLFYPSQIVFSFFSFAIRKNDHSTCNLMFWFLIFAFSFVYCLL